MAAAAAMVTLVAAAAEDAVWLWLNSQLRGQAAAVYVFACKLWSQSLHKACSVMGV